jgi:hypothetical protein
MHINLIIYKEKAKRMHITHLKLIKNRRITNLDKLHLQLENNHLKKEIVNMLAFQSKLKNQAIDLLKLIKTC